MLVVFRVVFTLSVVFVCCDSTTLSEFACSDEGCPIDQYLTTPQIVRRHGYASEAHVVETDDGYLLTLHRIPSSKNGTKGVQPVFLQHGLLSSSADWVDGGNVSLAFTLSDAGYDVWMGNARGNTYSTAHVTLSPHDRQFWDFSWHEMGIRDLPSALSHVANVTGKGGEIIYIGHSMGTTMFFVYSSILKEEANVVKAMIALAPVAYMTHLRSPIKYIAPWTHNIDWISRHLGLNEFLPNGKILKFLAYDCELLKYSKEICENIIFILCGFDQAEFDEDILPVVLSHAPAGTSTKTVVHFMQEIAAGGNFQMFDYGHVENVIRYGTPSPPNYNLSEIAVPAYLVYGDNDLMVGKLDVLRLYGTLKEKIGLYEVPLPNFNHVDFLWARDAPKLVYNPLLRVLQNYTS